MSKTLTNQEIPNFQPKCLKFGRAAAVTATGVVLPCCWLDQPSSLRDEKVDTLFEAKLNIDNNDTIEDIINSAPWQKFMRELVEKPKESSPICLRMCSTHYIEKEKWIRN